MEGRYFGHKSHGIDCLMFMLPRANPHHNILVMPTALFLERLALGILSREYLVTLKCKYYFKGFFIQNTWQLCCHPPEYWPEILRIWNWRYSTHTLGHGLEACQGMWRYKSCWDCAGGKRTASRPRLGAASSLCHVSGINCLFLGLLLERASESGQKHNQWTHWEVNNVGRASFSA